MKKIIAGFFLVPVLLFGVMVWPILYNYHIFSLARLKNSIEIGDGYEEVMAKFKLYESKHRGKSELELVYKSTELFIYHVNMFDDCQLKITFGTVEGNVNKIDYIGD